MMDASAILGIIAVVAVGGWFAAYIVARLVTRPATVPAAPATLELGTEPPAVVSLLVNRWRVTGDAAEATLLDLAARRFLELRQSGNDPVQTTIHLPQSLPDTGGLRPYERLILDRVRDLAVGGVVPLTALAFRDKPEAKSWHGRLREQVVADARGAGLSRPRFGAVVHTALVAAAAVAALAVSFALLHHAVWSDGEDNPGLLVAVLIFLMPGVFTFSILLSFVLSPGERDTPFGREAAARWLGVRDWLRGHEQFDELPPAAVTVWDRYLSYGAAVGATRLASAVLDLGLGDPTLVWSSFGGTWHRVRVRYPRFWPRYGRTAAVLLFRAAVEILLGLVLLGLFGIGDIRHLDRPQTAATAGALAVLGLGAYTLVRCLVDVLAERTITGEVLWLHVWQQNENERPRLHYLAVDDGTSDRARAWALPSQWAGHCRPRDTVMIRIRPWSRLVVAVVAAQVRPNHLPRRRPPAGPADNTVDTGRMSR
jgi:Predicted membrane protein (DUF2207)